jgi:hypothetical protein
MKRILNILFLFFAICRILNSQTGITQGKPIAEIFTDFHCNLDDTTQTTGFGLNRAYLGYNFLPAGNFSGTVIVNVGNPDDLPPGAVRRRYAYFREASITYTRNKLIVAFGITGTRLFDFQQKFWGKRYIANTYQSINGYGYVADLGVAIDYRFSDVWKGDITIMNGEGYSEVQLDNGVRTSAGLTFTPGNHIAARIYGDVENINNQWRYMLIGFLGFKNDLITIGGEVSYKSRLDMIGGHAAWGLSGTGGINVYKKTQLFARYDYSASVIVPGESIQWNWQKDGRFAIYGVQYTFNENVKAALNYQGTYPYDSNRKEKDLIYLNAMFRF